MHVFRIEHCESGYGPYHHKNYVELDSEQEEAAYKMSRSHSRGQHPVLWDDFPEHLVKSEMFCGFESLGKLRWWFKGWLRMLHRQGFRIVVYYSYDVAIGRSTKQVVFNKDNAIKLLDAPIIGSWLAERT